MDYLNDYAYDAQVAGLYYAVKPNDTGFQVTMVGYNDKMRTLLETVIDKIAEFEVRVDRFSVIKVVDNSSLQNCMFFCVSFSPVVDMPRTLEEPELEWVYVQIYNSESNSTLRIFCSSTAHFDTRMLFYVVL